MDVVAPPPPEKPEPGTVQPPQQHSADKDKPSKPQKATIEQRVVQPKQPGTGIGLAIFATVIIVLGLAALATYAYIKTNN
ncbi:MAG: hypothetical protein JWL89_262 [Candidatus Saccharibacteria bacterium]|nr:hypothetical protein [Candidatus Saccharibacteria bacterium]